MKAMVLAAGFGTRLQPLTCAWPKPMFPVLGRPLLSHTFDLLRQAGIRDIAVNVHHLPECIIDHYENTPPPNLNLHFSREEQILGTAGGIKNLQNFLGDGPFIVINSDVVTDINLNHIIEFHKNKDACLTLVVRQDALPEQYAPIEISKDGRVVRFVNGSLENHPEDSMRVMFTGIQVMEPNIFERIPAGKFCGTTEDVFPEMVKNGFPVYGYLYDGYWKDMGNRTNYLQVHADALDGKVKLKGISSHAPTGPLIVPPVLIGHNCHIAQDVQIGPYTVLGPGCTIKNGTIIERSVLWESATVGAGASIKQSIVARNTSVSSGKELIGESAV